MSNSTINKPGLDFLRQSSDKLAADAINKLIKKVGEALVEFGCSAPDEGSDEWFHQDGKTILLQLVSDSPKEGWPFWVWDRCTNKVLKTTEESLVDDESVSEITEFCPGGFSSLEAEVNFGEGETLRTYTVYGSVGESLGGEHVQLLKVVANDGDAVPEFNSAEISALRNALKSKAAE